MVLYQVHAIRRTISLTLGSLFASRAFSRDELQAVAGSLSGAPPFRSVDRKRANAIQVDIPFVTAGTKLLFFLGSHAKKGNTNGAGIDKHRYRFEVRTVNFGLPSC